MASYMIHNYYVFILISKQILFSFSFLYFTSEYFTITTGASLLVLLVLLVIHRKILLCCKDGLKQEEIGS